MHTVRNVHHIKAKCASYPSKSLEYGTASKLWQTSLYCGTSTVALHRQHVSRLEVQQQVFSSAPISCVTQMYKGLKSQITALDTTLGTYSSFAAYGDMILGLGLQKKEFLPVIK